VSTGNWSTENYCLQIIIFVLERDERTNIIPSGVVILCCCHGNGVHVRNTNKTVDAGFAEQ
jgi:hypothetical protein